MEAVLVAIAIIILIVYLIIAFVKGIIELASWALIIFFITIIPAIIFYCIKWIKNKKKNENYKGPASVTIVLAVILFIVTLHYCGFFTGLAYRNDVYEYESNKSDRIKEEIYDITKNHTLKNAPANPILVKHINDSIDNSFPNFLFGEIQEDDTPLDVIDFLTSIGYYDKRDYSYGYYGFYHDSKHSGISIGDLDIQEIHGIYQSNKLYGVVLRGYLNFDSLYDEISADTTSSKTSLETAQDVVLTTKNCKLQTVTNHFINKYGKPHYLHVSKQNYISYWHFNKKDILVYGEEPTSRYSSSANCFIAIFNPKKYQQFVDYKKRIEQELQESQLNELKRIEQQRISDSIQNAKEYKEELEKQKLKDSQKSKAIESL